MKKVYYLSGLSKVGKTTILKLIDDKNIKKVPEFLDDLPSYVYSTNSNYQTQKWIFDQFVKRNRLIESIDDGIVLCDRSPIDPIAFITASRDSILFNRFISMMKEVPWGFGHVILIEDHVSFLQSRYIDAGEKIDGDFFDRLRSSFRSLFDEKKVTIFPSEKRQAPLIDTLYISNIIRNEIYNPINLNLRILEIENTCLT